MLYIYIQYNISSCDYGDSKKMDFIDVMSIEIEIFNNQTSLSLEIMVPAKSWMNVRMCHKKGYFLKVNPRILYILLKYKMVVNSNLYSYCTLRNMQI